MVGSVRPNPDRHSGIPGARRRPRREPRRPGGDTPGERGHVFATNFVVAETHALVLARRSRSNALRFLRQFDAGTTVALRVRAIIERYADKDFASTDAISFAVMERLRIGHAFTFDRHVAQYGFAVLGPDHPV